MQCSICFRKPAIVIKTAAVCDYRPKSTAGQKMKRKGPMTLDLEPTPDILKDISLKKGTQVLVGFAAETENVLENARQEAGFKEPGRHRGQRRFPRRRRFRYGAQRSHHHHPR